MTSFNDNTLERQLSSLFRAEAQDAHLPLGTWQAISPKMGEPDRPSLFWQLRNALTFPRWRNPMKVKYAAPAATIALAAIAAILFVLLVNDDAENNGPVPAVTPTTPIQPTESPDIEATVQRAFEDATATAEAQVTPTALATTDPQATVAPQPTIAPVPTTPAATSTRPPIPTPAPTATPFPPIAVPQRAELQASAEVAIPVELLPSAERQAHDDVVSEWSRLFSGSIVEITGLVDGSEFNENVPGVRDFGTMELAFCDSGYGAILAVGNNQDASTVGELFTWEVAHSIANQWFAPNLRVEMLNPTLIPDFAFGAAAGNVVAGEPRSFGIGFAEDSPVISASVVSYPFKFFRTQDVSEICGLIP